MRAITDPEARAFRTDGAQLQGIGENTAASIAEVKSRMVLQQVADSEFPILGADLANGGIRHSGCQSQIVITARASQAQISNSAPDVPKCCAAGKLHSRKF